MGAFQSSVKPAPPAPGAKTQRLTTKEEECAGSNASFAASLEHVGRKGSPDRFLDGVEEDGREASEEVFSEEELDRFMRSLDAKLMPAGLRGVRSAQATWRAFWTARTKHWDELRARVRGEIDALERAIVRSLLVEDRAHLRSAFVGRRDVPLEDLAHALWRSHERGWRRKLSGRDAFDDGLERARAAAARFGNLPAPCTGAATPGLRPHEAMHTAKTSHRRLSRRARASIPPLDGEEKSAP
jgi:hypothetical protein